MRFDARRAHALAAMAVILLSIPLYFVNLGTPLLWADEATTALLARQVLASGLPLTGEGNDAGSQDYDKMRGWLGLDTQVGWVQDYLGALGIWLSGADGRSETIAGTRATTAWGRLPFAVCGVLTALFAGLLARYALSAPPRTGPGGPSERTVIALWATALTVSSHVQILHARQLRYFAPTGLLAVAVVHGYVRAIRGKRWGHTQLAVAGVLLMLSNDVVGVGVFAALCAAHVLLGRGASRRLLSALAWPGATFALWILVTLSANRYERLSTDGAVTLAHLLVETNAHVLPGAVLVAVLLARGFGRAIPAAPGLIRRFAAARAGGRDNLVEVVLLCGLTIASLVAVHGFIRVPYVRYLVPAVPLASVLVASLALSSGRWTGPRPWVAALLLVAISLTDIGGWVSDLAFRTTGLSSFATRRHGHWRQPRTHWDLARGLQDSSPRPLQTVLQHLWESASPDDTVLISYGDQTMRFYSRLTVYGGWTGYLPSEPEELPSWIWLRARSPRSTAHAGNPIAWVEQHVDLSRYQRIELPVADAPWESRPDPDYFWAPQPAPPIVLYRLER